MELSNTISQIRTLHNQRTQWIRAKNRLILQGKAMCRQFTDGDKTKANKLYNEVVKILRSDAPISDDLHHAALLVLRPLVLAEQPLLDELSSVEKELVKQVKKLPVYVSFWKGVKGGGEMGLASIIGELGDLSRYEKRVHGIWKRMGLSLIHGERQRKCADKDLALLHGYSPHRRSVMWNVGNSIVGAGKLSSPRPFVGEDIYLRDDWTDYQKLFVERCRFEASKLDSKGKPLSREPVLDEKSGRMRESYSVIASARAKRFVEKRVLRDLYRAWVGQPLGDDFVTEAQRKYLEAA